MEGYNSIENIRSALSPTEFKKLLLYIDTNDINQKQVLVLCGNGLGKTLTKEYLEFIYKSKGRIMTSRKIVNSDDAYVVVFDKIKNGGK